MKTLFLLALVGMSARADVIVSGKTVMGCAVDDASVGQPSAPDLLSPAQTAPATCADFSGEWKGGCFGAGNTYPTNWPTKNGYVVIGPLGLDSLVTAAAVKGVDPLKDDPPSKLQIKVTQDACNSVTFVSGATTKKIDFTHRSRVTQTEHFRRTCYSDQYQWRRTYDFLHQNVETPVWKNGGTWFRQNITWDGRDANYDARLIQTINRDWSLENGVLKVSGTSYYRTSKFDPPGFDWDPGDVGSDLCVFRKVGP